MKKTNFTFRIFERSLTTLLLLFAMFFSPSLANACELSCGGKQQVSLDENCQAEITAEMILSDGGASCPNGVFSVAAKLTPNGAVFASGSSIILDGTYIGRDIIIEITVNNNGIINKCWSTITLEDKLPPVIACVDVTVSCGNLDEFLPQFIGLDCDNNPVINLISQTEEGLCDEFFLKRITRTYTATDKYGNTSAPCTQTIMVERFDFEDVVVPPHFMLVSNNALDCDAGYATDEKGNPNVSVTGVPRTSGGEALYPLQDFSCNLVIVYNDLVLPEVGCVTKVMRTWTFSEWVCGEDEVFEYVQVIEIADDEGPAISPLSDVTISTTTGYNCQALYLLPQVIAEDNCKNVKRIDIAYPGGFISDYDGNEIITLGTGVNEILVTAYDGCLNSNTISFDVFVNDKTAPVAVCDRNTVVALSSEGYTNVSALSFDDGSYDECGILKMEVKRMDNGSACGENWNQFGSHATFCCADIGKNTVVIFRIYDLAGNYNDCMVNVEVQDKLPPTITCPANITVECDFDYEFTEAGLIAAFGDATYADNCSGSLTRSAFIDIDQCNVGRIIRTFTASDANGSRTCQQVITFVNSEPFNGQTGIKWPKDVTISDCLDLEMGMSTAGLAAVSPDATGRPIITEDICDMVGAEYKDRIFEVFNASTASCFKIIRTWTVLDWCQRDRDGRYASWSYDQVIMVNNNVAPTFTFTCDDIVLCTFDGECNDGEVVLIASATDDCTPDEALAWRYSIDAYNDGTFDIVSGIITGGQVSATGNYPIGKHRIVWTVEDRCGNSTSCEQLFTVENCKTPTPYCIHGLAVSLMSVDNNNDGQSDGGMIDIWASDFDAGSFHQCGYDVSISFSSDPTDTGRTFTCADIGIQDVDIWATTTLPDGTIVQDFCTTYVDIQDNQNACGENTGNKVAITGSIATETEESVEEVKVYLERSEMPFQMTNNQGKYAFSSIGTGGTYAVNPSKNVEHMNGVSTLDLVLIQRHILGLEYLTSPYKIIAADINNDKAISANDLLQLRKSILGMTEGFQNNTSWRFVDKNYEFIDATNPLNDRFGEVYDINNLSNNMEVDFIAVKVGDVNESAIANQKMAAQVRENPRTLIFATNDMLISEGETVRVPVYAENFNEILAFQYSISSTDVLSVLQVEKGILDLDESNFGFQKALEGVVTTSWNSLNPVSYDNDDVLFTLVIQSYADVNLSEALSFNSAVTKAEAYTEGENLNVELNVRTNPSAGANFVLYQNTPNPFNGITSIQFELPENSKATLSVFDVTGKLVYTYTNDFEKGSNYIELQAEDLSANGVLYYTLQTDVYTATKKMVVVR